MNLYRQFKSFAPRAFDPRRWLGAAKRKGLQLATLLINLLLLSVVLVVADHLPFIDVPSNAFFHDAVSAVFGARITTGTTPTTFSPEDPVTRGQMAVFLHRGLGRIAYKQGSVLSLSSNLQDLAVLTINTGGAAGGTGFLKVDAAFTATNISNRSCPCLVQFFLSADDNAVSQTHYLVLHDAGTGAGEISLDSGAVTMAFSLGTGHLLQNVRLRGKVTNAIMQIPPNSIQGQGSITAIYAPFGDTGGNTLSVASADQGDAPQGTEPDARPDVHR